MSHDQIKEALTTIQSFLDKELKRINETGHFSNWVRVAQQLEDFARTINALGRMRESEMKLKLNKQLRLTLLQLGAMLLADASDGQIDDADHISSLLILTGKSIRDQNGLPPI